MVNENLVIGVHGDTNLIGGQYNVLSSFTAGLLKGFQNNGAKAFTTQECKNKGLTPGVTIGFNVTGYSSWPEYMSKNIPNIMWSVDSTFCNNFEIINEFANNPYFILFNVTPGDSIALNKFFPNLKHTNFSHAVDLDLWKKQDCKKEHDIVFLSSIFDYESKIEELRMTTEPQSFDFMMDLFNIWSKSSNASFFQISELLKEKNNIDLPVDEYYFVFSNLAGLISSRKRIEMIQSLKDFNVKVFGNGPWEKYIQGKVQYMGSCDLIESIDVMNKAKIVLHNHPQQISLGLHERILNASAVETFVLSTQNPAIISEFGNSMDYFEVDYRNSAQLMSLYLNNKDERISKAKEAHKIVKERHTWDVRAKQILEIID